MESTYMVYCHINATNGKKYFGITTNPEQRWQNGHGYQAQFFGKAIKKYGWENFQHEILFSKLSRSEAARKEFELIKLHKTNNSLYGYNVSDNEGGGRPSKYATPEEAAEAKKESDKKSGKKRDNKTKSDPVLKSEAMKKQVEANARSLAKIPQEEKREKWRKAKQAQREREKQPSKVNTIPCKTDFINQFKENHQKAACEIAEEL